MAVTRVEATATDIAAEWAAAITTKDTTTTSTGRAPRIVTSMEDTTITTITAAVATSDVKEADSVSLTSASVATIEAVVDTIVEVTLAVETSAVSTMGITAVDPRTTMPRTTLAVQEVTRVALARARLTNQAKTRATTCRWNALITPSASATSKMLPLRRADPIMEVEVAIAETTTEDATTTVEITTTTTTIRDTTRSQASRCRTMKVLARADTRVERTRWESRPRVGVVTLGDVGSAVGAVTEVFESEGVIA